MTCCVINLFHVPLRSDVRYASADIQSLVETDTCFKIRKNLQCKRI
jgi:hypothetical protein